MRIIATLNEQGSWDIEFEGTELLNRHMRRLGRLLDIEYRKLCRRRRLVLTQANAQPKELPDVTQPKSK